MLSSTRAAERRRGLLDRLVRAQLLFADDPLEHGAAQQLLGDGALPLLGVERLHAAQQFRRQRRIGDADLGLRLVLARQEHRERRADRAIAEHQRDDEPPLAALQHRQVVERVKATFFHYWILMG